MTSTKASPGPRNVAIVTADGVEISGRLFRPPDSQKAHSAVLIASAMGVSQAFYSKFAQYLAARGFGVLTIDYRGIGASRSGSLRGSPITLNQWGDLDLRAAVDYLDLTFTDTPVCWLGHSVGGQLLGLIGDERISRALLIAAQSGHWRHWHGLDRLKLFAIWYLAIPAVVPLFGMLPARALGGGEDVPPGVATQWATWGRHPDYIEAFARTRAGHGFSDFGGALRAYTFTDDRLAPGRSVKALVNGFETSDRQLIEIDPSEVGLASIGHFGAFRSKGKDTLWPQFAAWLGGDESA